jgi:chromosome segregation ATPase
MAALEKEVAEKRGERERIRSELLPAIERRRDELREREHQLDAEIRRLSDEIGQIGRVSLEAEGIEVD